MAHGGARQGAGRKPLSAKRITEDAPKITVVMKDTLGETCRQYTGQLLEVLLEIAFDPGTAASARNTAATTVLERGWGKAPALFDEKTSDGTIDADPSRLTDAEIAEYRRLSAKLTTPAAPVAGPANGRGNETTAH